MNQAEILEEMKVRVDPAAAVVLVQEANLEAPAAVLVPVVPAAVVLALAVLAAVVPVPAVPAVEGPVPAAPAAEAAVPAPAAEAAQAPVPADLPQPHPRKSPAFRLMS